MANVMLGSLSKNPKLRAWSGVRYAETNSKTFISFITPGTHDGNLFRDAPFVFTFLWAVVNTMPKRFAVRHVYYTTVH